MSEFFSRFGLLCAGAMLTTLLVAGVWHRRQGVGYGVWVRLCVLGIPLAWLGARLAYCLVNIPYYVVSVENPALMLRFLDGGFSLFGAMGGMALAAFLTAKWQRVSAAVLLDGIALGASVGIIVERLAQDGTSIGWGRYIQSAWLQPIGVTENLWHPVYLYQAAAMAILLLILLAWLCSRKGQLADGDLTLVFITLYGCAEVVLESFCKDGHMTVRDGLVHINQIIAIVLPVIALAIWSVRAARRGTKKSQIIIVWLITVACIGIGIKQEFAVDRNNNLYRDYSIMAAAVTVIAGATLFIRHKAEST